MSKSWCEKQIEGTSIIFLLDPDAIIRFYTNVVCQERAAQSEIITSLVDLFDPDKCPERYLPYLAGCIGLKIDSRDGITRQRRMIKSAVAWYKEKGKVSAFQLMFRSLGFDAVITPVWTDKKGHYHDTLDPPPAGYIPHARISIGLYEINGDVPVLLPEDIDRIMERMEEVRPIHVLLQRLKIGFGFIDQVPPIEDAAETALGLFFPFDRFNMMGGTGCAISHFYGARPAVLHDGVYFDGQARRGRVNEFTGDIHRRGDAWQEIPTLIDRSHAVKVFHNAHVPENYDGVPNIGGIPLDRSGRHSDVNLRLFHHDGISSWLYDRSCFGAWELDNLLIGVNRLMEDQFFVVYYHNGEIEERTSLIDRSGMNNAQDDLDIVLAPEEFEDPTDPVTDGSEAVIARSLDDEVHHCCYYHDGEIPDRSHGYFYHHDWNAQYHHDGLFFHDGTIDRRDYLITHDGFIDDRRAHGTYLRDSANPFGDCSSPTGEIVSFNVIGAVNDVDSIDPSTDEVLGDAVFETSESVEPIAEGIENLNLAQAFEDRVGHCLVYHDGEIPDRDWHALYHHDFNASYHRDGLHLHDGEIDGRDYIVTHDGEIDRRDYLEHFRDVITPFGDCSAPSGDTLVINMVGYGEDALGYGGAFSTWDSGGKWDSGLKWDVPGYGDSVVINQIPFP